MGPTQSVVANRVVLPDHRTADCPRLAARPMAEDHCDRSAGTDAQLRMLAVGTHHRRQAGLDQRPCLHPLTAFREKHLDPALLVERYGEWYRDQEALVLAPIDAAFIPC